MNTTEMDVMIGNRVRAFRILRKLSTDELAAVIGAKKNTITRIEAGRTSITAPQLVLIARKLETTSSVLTGEREYEGSAEE